MLRKNENFVIPPRVTDDRPTCRNPVIPDFADPSVSYDPETGYYYACRSRFHPHGVNVCRGRTLSALFDEQITVFTTDGEKNGLYNGVWASELHKIDGLWYIYAAASCHPTKDYADRKMRTFVLKSRTSDPFDGFDFAGLLSETESAIDCTIWQDKAHGRLFCCFSRCMDVDRGELVIQEMESPTKLKGEPVLLARASYPWELVEPYVGCQRILEGAYFLENAGRTFIVYSANGCWIDQYCLGILELMTDEPLNISAWVKDDVPLFSYGNGVFAPGHASFFKSPDGKETWIAYHAVTEHNPNDSPLPRHMCAQRVYFDETGFPHIGKPLPFGEEYPLPSGDTGVK